MGIIRIKSIGRQTPSLKARLRKLWKKNKIYDIKMASQFTMIVLLSTMVAMFLTMTTEAKSAMKCGDDWDCKYGEYCHFQKKTCKKSQPSCVLSAQQISCMILAGDHSLVKSFENLACHVVTEDKKKQKQCDAAFESIENVAQNACDVALAQICCPQNCPENMGSEACKKFGRNYKC